MISLVHLRAGATAAPAHVHAAALSPFEGEDFMSDLLATIRDESQKVTEEMTFAAYLEVVQKDPKLVRSAHQRIYDMIVAAGVRQGTDGEKDYRLFEAEVFGLDTAIRQIVEYFAASARRLDTRRRMLLLVGPPGSGKSTLARVLKKGLEAYTRRDEGTMYAIRDCPMQEEPLHLIPPHLRDRPELSGLRVEGDLCPYCRWMVDEIYKGDVSQIPIRRVLASESAGRAVGTFVATDPRSEDISRLVGSVDTTRTSDNEGAAFRLDGELNVANRGLLELVEIFKMDERFLSVLLSLSQEQIIKLAGAGVISADEAVVAHTNLPEYEALTHREESRALQDRLVVVRVPYLLSVRQERRIYDKMLAQADLGGLHVSPHATTVAATFSVLTRLGQPMSWRENMKGGLQLRLQFHDGRLLPQDPQAPDLPGRAAAPDEGLIGVSPRYAINQISRALSQGAECLDPMDLLRLLWNGLTQKAGFREEEREGWLELFRTARSEYDELVRRTIRRAMVPDFRDRAESSARTCREELAAWADDRREDGLSMVARLEKALGVNSRQRETFRTELYRTLAMARRVEMLYEANPLLERGLEALLLPSWKEACTRLSSQDAQAQLQGPLIEREGLCEIGARRLIEQARSLQDPVTKRSGRGPRLRGWLQG